MDGNWEKKKQKKKQQDRRVSGLRKWKVEAGDETMQKQYPE